ncbi:MAG: carboxypeptidase-like regulatory domain-containing protein [Bacteroidales bacterium]|nr:carboxypeptidase-like regulatory domain-containing protein [Bacteroidales bacterium]
MKTSLKFIVCLAICMGIVFAASSQSIRVTGKVTTPDGTEIAGVHIFDSIANVGASSDKNGIFSLTIPQKATRLRFSHVAFETKYLPLTEKRLADTIVANTIWLEVVLTQALRKLPVVEISDAKVQIAYKNPKQWILDYEPVGTDEFLLLLIEKNKKYLELVNSNHEKISQIVIDKDYKELFKDHSGYFHLLSRDSACQAFLVDEELILDYHNIRHDFSQFVEPVVVNTENYLYMKDYFTVNDQLVSYNKINKETKETTPFVEIFDEKQAIYNSDCVSKFMGDFIKCCKLSDIDVTPELIASFRAILINSKNVDEYWRSRLILGSAGMCVPLDQKNLSFYKQVLAKPPYSLLAKIHDTIYFFDHLNNKIAAYDLDGNYLKETPITYHDNKGWDKEIIVNEEKTRCFAKFTRNGETSLVEINPNTGQTMGTYILEVHAFPTKIRVRGNEIYYLCKDYFEGEQKYFLWKQKVE